MHGIKDPYESRQTIERTKSMELGIELPSISPLFHIFLIVDSHTNLEEMQEWFTTSSHDDDTKEYDRRCRRNNFVFDPISNFGEISSTIQKKGNNG